MYAASPYSTGPYNSPAQGGGAAPITWALSLAVVQTTATPVFPLSLAVTGEVTPEWALSLAVVDPAAITESAAHAWSRGILVDGVDWSARLVGPSRVDAEAGASAVASVTLALTAGAFDPADWTGAEVALDYTWTAADGSAAYTLRQFTGQVDAFRLDPARQTITLTCSDRRKGLLLGASQAQIATLLTGSLWSDAFFNADVDGLRYAEDRLSTLAADFDLDADGTPRLTAWAAKVAPDWTIDRILADSLAVDFARHTDLVHQVEVKLDYRFARLRLREARIKYVFDLMDMATDHIAMPTSALVEDAIADAGWDVLDDPVYVRPAEYYDIGGVFYLCDSENGVREATARLGKRFAQSVEEHYTLTVSASASGLDPRLKSTLSGALESAFDAAAWEKDITASPVLASPGWGMETAGDATTDPDTGRAGAQNAVRCGLAMAARKILESHRQNSVEFTVPLNPFLSRAHTVALDQPDLDATGKVRRLVHELDPDSGRALTTVTLALSRPTLANPAASDAHTPPATPAIPAPSAEVIAAHYMELGNIIGGKAGAAAYDEDWSGWIINVPSESKVSGMLNRWTGMAMSASGEIYGQGQGPAFAVTSSETPASKFDGTIANPDYVAANAYPVQFRVVTPEVETAARDNLDVALADDYLVRVPEDVFTYTI